VVPLDPEPVVPLEPAPVVPLAFGRVVPLPVADVPGRVVPGVPGVAGTRINPELVVPVPKVPEVEPAGPETPAPVVVLEPEPGLPAALP